MCLLRGMPFSEAKLKPFVRVCFSPPGETHRTQLSGGSGPIVGGSSPIRRQAVACGIGSLYHFEMTSAKDLQGLYDYAYWGGSTVPVGRNAARR